MERHIYGKPGKLGPHVFPQSHHGVATIHNFSGVADFVVRVYNQWLGVAFLSTVHALVPLVTLGLSTQGRREMHLRV